MSAARIDDYALIGNGLSAALISRGGSVDWMCWPRFDSPALFAHILDKDRGGSWRIGPLGSFKASRNYLEHCPVLQTTFRTNGGLAVLTDLMPVPGEGVPFLQPQQELVRHLYCDEGSVDFEFLFDPRPEYGMHRAHIIDRGGLGLFFETRQFSCYISASIALRRTLSGALWGRIRLSQGEECSFCLSMHTLAPAPLPPLGTYSDTIIHRTVASWKQWNAQMTYGGPCREMVLQSIQVLKLLTYAPSGGLVSAPTTSLPLLAGRSFNWDQRFCRLSTLSFCTRAFIELGYRDEALHLVNWALHTIRNGPSPMQGIYDVYGNRPPHEHILSHLQGHRGALPVRSGTESMQLRTMHSYGELIDAAARVVQLVGPLERSSQQLLDRYGEVVCAQWRLPGNGPWESRGKQLHYTHCRLLCWVALDRLLSMTRHHRLSSQRCALFAHHRTMIEQDLHRYGWNRRHHCYSQTLGGEIIDSSALLFANYGFEPADGLRMRRCWQLLQKKLQTTPPLLHRNEQSRRLGEGPSAQCSFWAVEYLARGGGSLYEAQRTLGSLLSKANDVGLFAEHMESDSAQGAGNFPHAATHAALICAALSVTQRQSQEGAGPIAGYVFTMKPKEVQR